MGPRGDGSTERNASVPKRPLPERRSILLLPFGQGLLGAVPGSSLTPPPVFAGDGEGA